MLPNTLVYGLLSCLYLAILSRNPGSEFLLFDLSALFFLSRSLFSLVNLINCSRYEFVLNCVFNVFSWNSCSGDFFAGFNSWLTTGDYEKGKEEHQTKRYGGIKKKQIDESALQGARDNFDNGDRKLFTDYENKVITKEEVNELRETYASYTMQEIPASEYKAARNRLLKRAKEMQSIDSSTDAEFAELTGNDSHAKPNPSTVKEGSKEAVGTKSNTTAMGTQSGMDQMTAMTIQAKLIAMEMMKMNSNPDYINKQKELMKVSGVAMANKLTGE